MNRRRPLLYFLALLPGLGHFYLGLMTRGLQFMLLFFGTIFLIANSFGSLALVLPVIVFYSYFDALQLHRLYQDMTELYDEPLITIAWLRRKKHVFGWVLIALGCLTVMKQIMNYLPQYISIYVPYDLVQNVIMSGTLILIGFQLLRNKHEDAWDTLEQ
ncbi:hypothetical protein [Ectobacillus ponti]|uniref:Uncharacterized protein n=1 Tax=Ectobacillus ponti TaxID=2961894 RepID=A0AA41X6P2_9BACI|nr:hypothetical protein [Ectobacillus ponti]MCP8968193.1 hypothetical protein [Ectobacillus ponti]